MKKIKVGNKSIGEKKPCFIIAEAGVNHNGDIELAKKLVDIAKEAGVDAVKFQTFHAEETVSLNSKKASYQDRAKEKTQYEMLKNLELSFDEFRELKKYCDNNSIEFISTPYDIKSVEFLNNIGVKRFKVASADLINKPLIEAIAETKKQIILSTGMATLGEIERTISLIYNLGNRNIILLHCTTSYPTSYDQVNMNILHTLKEAFGLPVGYSDHTLGIEIPIMAVSMGAKVVEKHFTLDRTMEGPDHFASLEPNELKEMVKSIRNIEKSFGSKRKEITAEEKKNIFFMRRSIHASIDIKTGEVIKANNIKITRPFNGIESWFIDVILGKKLKNNIKKDDPIRWKDLL
ncbi:MAG: N-acetylneuraminate synthase [Parcubacteria group bacterium]|nr:N-acetylneuraminate synthase [Parcubacteria group bacterium]